MLLFGLKALHLFPGGASAKPLSERHLLCVVENIRQGNHNELVNEVGLFQTHRPCKLIEVEVDVF